MKGEKELESELKEQIMTAKDTRGGTDQIEKNLDHSNFVMIFGTTPSNQVLLETKMVENLLDHLILKQDPR